MRPVVALMVGVRGIPVADLCRPLAGWADVVVMSAKDLMAQRHDPVDGSWSARDVVLAPDAAHLVATAMEYARTHRIDGVFTVSEDAVETTAEFAALAGLPGQPVSTVRAFRDKYLQRGMLADAKVPVPPYAELTGPESVDAALARVPLPAILKPTRASGGALAYVVSAAEQLPDLLAEASGQVGSAGGAVERDTTFILEGLLVGVDSHPVPGFAPYVSVETLATSGTYHHLAVTDRFPVSPPALETGMMLPSCLGPDQRERLLVAAEKALRALGFHHGAAHTELMLTADGPRVIEVNARVGGALPYLFPMASDLDLIEQAARVAVGLPPVTTPTFNAYAVFVGPQHPVGVHVEAVEGFAETAALPGVWAVFPVAVGGARTDAFNGTLIAAVLATVPDAASAAALWRDVMRTIRPRYSPAELPDHHRRTPTGLAGHLGTARSPSLRGSTR